MKTIYKYYRNKYVFDEPSYPKNKHAIISVVTYEKKDFAEINKDLKDCEQQSDVEYIKPMSSVEQTWEQVMNSTGATFNNRGKNIVLECLQFGGNREFWKELTEEQIRSYFQACYDYAVWKIGLLPSYENIICAVIITEPNRRNLYVYYLPIVKNGLRKALLSHSEFWKQRGGLTSYSDLQEEFYNNVSKQYGAIRGKSYSLIKNTNLQQQERYGRHEGDRYDELFINDSPF